MLNRIHILFILIVTVCIAGQDGLSQRKDTTSLIPLNFGFPASVLPEMNERDVKAAIKVWSEGFIDKSYYKSSFYIYDDLNALIGAITDGEINIAPLPPVDFIRTSHRIPLYPALCGKIYDSVSDRFVLLVRKESRFNGIRDLEGRSILIKNESPNSLMKIWLEVMLHSADLPPSTHFFSEIIKKDREFQLIFPLILDQADCCIMTQGAFRTMCELNPQLDVQLTTLVASDSLMISTILVFTEQLEEESRNHVKFLALNWAKTKSTDQLQILFRFNELIPFEEKYLESIQSLLKNYNHFRNSISMDRGDTR